MTVSIDATHAVALTSWVDSAQAEDTDFPIQNLPFGHYVGPQGPSLGIAIGDQILDLHRSAGLLTELSPELQAACRAPNLDAILELGREASGPLRAWAHEVLRTGSDHEASARGCLVAQADVEMQVPATIRDYTDFYASVFHATNVGSLFRPDNPLLPNYKHIPIGYHGRASTIVPSGVDVPRPKGQRKAPDDPAPSYGPCRLMDYEMEVGLWIGGSTNPLGETVPVERAEERLFGLCLLNDWSARDIQGWEYQPLGPFLAKSFATSISPWIVTVEALAPFRCAEFDRPEGDPEPLEYLRSGRESPGFDVRVQVFLRSEKMRAEGMDPVRLSETSMANLYWTPEQMIAHHASNGCSLQAGDLYGTGTISGPGKGELGAMLEITRRGQELLDLPDGTQRAMLNDGDEVLFRAYCEATDARRIGFGECRATVLPAIPAQD